MPQATMRKLVGRTRTRRANRQLGLLLAFVAGAVNAGGFLAIHRYTSHMTGVVSGVADDLALGNFALAAAGVLLVCVFIAGATTTALLTLWARNRHLNSEYALSLLLEATLLLVFGLLGTYLAQHSTLLVPATVALLCFIMGLQNAVVTKISHAEIRTTHMTGVVTDLGIELGRLLYCNRSADSDSDSYVRADRDKLMILGSILACFAVGGLTGALAFKHLSYAATIPIALLLAGLALVPILDDLRHKGIHRKSPV
ncbi:MAG: YoaK family protein [Pseudomonadota bacterium]|nr:YoaK family protein [Pseudomonadota bacterium]